MLAQITQLQPLQLSGIEASKVKLSNFQLWFFLVNFNSEDILNSSSYFVSKTRINVANYNFDNKKTKILQI